MQYVLSDAEYDFVYDVKKTIRSWNIIFERFKLKFKDCPLTTKANSNVVTVIRPTKSQRTRGGKFSDRIR